MAGGRTAKQPVRATYNGIVNIGSGVRVICQPVAISELCLKA
jgi:hypothetical protein